VTHGHADMTAIAPHEKRPTNVKKRPIIPLAYLTHKIHYVHHSNIRSLLSLPPSLPPSPSLTRARARSLYNHLYCQHLGRWSGFDPPYLDRPGRQLHHQGLGTTLHRGQRRLHWSVVVLRGRAGKAFSSGDRCTIRLQGLRALPRAPAARLPSNHPLLGPAECRLGPVLSSNIADSDIGYLGPGQKVNSTQCLWAVSKTGCICVSLGRLIE